MRQPNPHPVTTEVKDSQMTASLIHRAILPAILLALLATQAPAQQPTDLTIVRPETAGFSSERLENLHALMQQAVDTKQIAGDRKSVV